MLLRSWNDGLIWSARLGCGVKAGYKQAWHVGQRQTWKAKFRIFDPSHFKLLKFTVPVGIHAMQNCVMTFTSQSQVFCPVSGVKVEDPGAACTSEKEKLRILKPPFLTFVLGSWLPCWFGWGDSPSAETGVVGQPATKTGCVWSTFSAC